MEEKKITPSLEDYLESIYVLREQIQIVRVTDIAAHLHISKPSVHRALQMLRNMAYVEQEKYGDVRLTQEGEEKARQILSRHMLLKTFFCDVLGVSEEIAEKDACMTEHVISEETVQKLNDFVSHVQKQKE